MVEPHDDHKRHGGAYGLKAYESSSVGCCCCKGDEDAEDVGLVRGMEAAAAGGVHDEKHTTHRGQATHEDSQSDLQM